MFKRKVLKKELLNVFENKKFTVEIDELGHLETRAFAIKLNELIDLEKSSEKFMKKKGDKFECTDLEAVNEINKKILKNCIDLLKIPCIKFNKNALDHDELDVFAKRIGHPACISLCWEIYAIGKIKDSERKK